MKAIIESAGKVASRTTLGNHQLIFDQPTTVYGGEDRGPSPLDVMAVSVAACVHYFAAAFLHGRGLSTNALTVEVAADKDRSPISRLGRIAMKVRLPTGLSPDQVRQIERGIRNCPAYGTLLHPPALDLIVDAAVEPEAAAV